ncbi:MAG: hypothetical protein CVT48_01055 [Thermoplasmata archaeon HGW-Thermoplasmata-1]|nr:MAG: hypothetical protein CVT48_01055 [Thermoplasmata archaeon HGW-Thermoplasmata-1]
MKGKILVVDDEDDILNLAKIMLEGEGYEVVTAPDGDDALAKANSELPDLVLLDIILPGKNGFDVCRILKQDSKTRFIPIVLFSALGRDTDKKMGKDAGANGYIVKPFTIDILKGEVEKHLAIVRKIKFSAALALSHQQVSGRKILLGFDPAAPYEMCLRDFVIEFMENGDEVVVITNPSSNLYAVAKCEERIQTIEAGAQLMLSPILEQHAGKSVAMIYDNLTDLIISDGIKTAYAFVKSALERLADRTITALFLINPDAHPQSEASSIRSLFGSHLSFGRDGLVKMKMN